MAGYSYKTDKLNLQKYSLGTFVKSLLKIHNFR